MLYLAQETMKRVYIYFFLLLDTKQIDKKRGLFLLNIRYPTKTRRLLCARNPQAYARGSLGKRWARLACYPHITVHRNKAEPIQ